MAVDAVEAVAAELMGELEKLIPRSSRMIWPPGRTFTMGCGEACPIVPGVERDDWPLEDPKGQPPARVRQIRDEIARRVRSLLIERGWVGAVM